MKPDSKKAEKINQKIKVGRFLKGEVVVDESGIAVQNVPIGDFQGQSIVRQLTMRFTQPLTEQDRLKV